MPLDLWPTFWQRMTEMINGGQVFISVKVKEEIEHGNDELVTWLRDSAPKSCFISLDTDNDKVPRIAELGILSTFYRSCKKYFRTGC
jgi:hypothetical protein